VNVLLRAMMTLLCLLSLQSTVVFAEEVTAIEPVATESTTEIASTEVAAAPTPAADLPSLLSQLVQAEDFEIRAALIQQLASRTEPQILGILNALVEGQLNSNSANPTQVLIVAADGEDPDVMDALTGKSIGKSSQFTLDTIPLNNALRGELRAIIARLQLSSVDKNLRLAAAKQLINNEPDQFITLQFSDKLDPNQNLEGLISIANPNGTAVVNNEYSDYNAEKLPQKETKLTFLIENNAVKIYSSERYVDAHELFISKEIKNSNGKIQRYSKHIFKRFRLACKIMSFS